MNLSRQELREARRVVVKVGSNVLVGGVPGVVNRSVFAQLVQSLSTEINDANRNVVLVSSGAVALGRRRARGVRPSRALAQMQAMAALGQSALMQLYEHEFAFYDLLVGQILLTQGDISDRKRFINARRTLKLLSEELGAIPIVNENDTVATEELRLGDNDRLAALVSLLFEADALLILSDVDGLYTANPTIDPSAELISCVDPDDDSLQRLIWASSTGPGRGGMGTKLEAARMAAKAGVPTIIAPGRMPHVVNKVLAGEDVGTLFAPTKDKLNARRLWIMHGPTSDGRLRVDRGAALAITENGKSLLPSGLLVVEGSFSEGAAVEVMGPQNELLARGLVSYASADLLLIKGHQSREIESILGFKRVNYVIHRDDMVLL